MSTTVTVTIPGNWNIPAGATSLDIVITAAGGRGADNNGGGGGGGSRSEVLGWTSFTPGTAISFTLGDTPSMNYSTGEYMQTNKGNNGTATAGGLGGSAGAIYVGSGTPSAYSGGAGGAPRANGDGGGGGEAGQSGRNGYASVSKNGASPGCGNGGTPTTAAEPGIYEGCGGGGGSGTGVGTDGKAGAGSKVVVTWS